ncbi:MAG: ECF transporter S component [bacterium]|nr:ECF transporter S component [bacterium]
MLSKLIRRLLLFGVIPGSIAIGIVGFNDRRYYAVALIISISVCLIYMLSFEEKKISTRRIVLLSIMIALCTLGRFLFLPIPGFKPVTAIVVLTGLYFGSEAGLVTGAMAALVSNMVFGQGPWTPFQMIAWGLIGFVAGGRLLQGFLRSKIGLTIYGIIAGIAYSLIMDVWSTLALDGSFVFARFVVKVSTSLPFMVIYAVSNVVFLLVLRKPMGEKLSRIKRIYNI